MSQQQHFTVWALIIFPYLKYIYVLETGSVLFLTLRGKVRPTEVDLIGKHLLF
jgi:hypothetical protein